MDHIATADYVYRNGDITYEDAYLIRPVIQLCRQWNFSRVLDVGCGNGRLCQALCEAGIEAVGCDPSESGIRAARESVPGASFEQLGVYDDPATLPHGKFDAVVALEVI